MNAFILLVIIGLIVLFFVSRKLSPVPYFPANKQDLPHILKALKLRNGQTVVDLGAGDGKVIFAAASTAKKRKLSTQFLAVEINPILVLILHLRKLFHPNRQNIRILLADMFKLNLSNLTKGETTIFLYISPWFMEKIYKKLKTDLKTFELISYFYPLPHRAHTKTIKGKNNIFIYLAGTMLGEDC
jgi:hypothetical protein